MVRRGTVAGKSVFSERNQALVRRLALQQFVRRLQWRYG
jgi:hypothetical protein